MRRRPAVPKASLPALGLALALAGCGRAPAPQPPGRLEGYWIARSQGSTSTLNVAGNRYYLQGPGRQDWYKGRFTIDGRTDPPRLVLLVEDCACDDRGKEVRAVFRAGEDGLLLAATRPGSPEWPRSLEEARGVRLFRFERWPARNPARSRPSGAP